MREVGLRKMRRDFYDEIKDMPFILTRDKQPYAVILSYEDYQTGFSLKDVMQRDAIERGDTAEIEYKGAPIIKDDIKPDEPYHLNSTPSLQDAIDAHEKPKSSFLTRIKEILLRPVL